MTDYNLIRPQDPSGNATQFEIESWKKELKMYWKRGGIYMDNKTKLFSLIWGQSSKATQSKIETHLNYGQCYLGVLRGKTTRRKANPIKEQFFDVPEPKNIVLNVFHWIGVPDIC